MDVLPAVPQTSQTSTLLDAAAMLLHGLRFSTHRSVALNGEHVSVSVAAWGTTDDGAAYVGLPADDRADTSPERRAEQLSEVLVTCRPHAPFAPRDMRCSGVPVFLLPDAQQGDGWFGRFDAFGRVVFRRVPPGHYRLSVSSAWAASQAPLVTMDALMPTAGEDVGQLTERFSAWRSVSESVVAMPAGAGILGHAKDRAVARAAVTAAQLQLAAFRDPIVIEAAGGTLKAELTPHLTAQNLEIAFSVVRPRLRRPRVRFAFVDAKSHAVYQQAEVPLVRGGAAADQWTGRWRAGVSLPAPSEFVAQLVEEESETDSSANGPSGSDTAK